MTFDNISTLFLSFKQEVHHITALNTGLLLMARSLLALIYHANFKPFPVSLFMHKVWSHGIKKWGLHIASLNQTRRQIILYNISKLNFAYIKTTYPISNVFTSKRPVVTCNAIKMCTCASSVFRLLYWPLWCTLLHYWFLLRHWEITAHFVYGVIVKLW